MKGAVPSERLLLAQTRSDPIADPQTHNGEVFSMVSISRVTPRDESPTQEEMSGCFGSSRWPSTTAAATSASLELVRRDWSRSISKASASSTE